MPYGNKYQIRFRNELQELYEVFIAFDGYVGDVTTLKASGNPLQLNYINNSEDVLDPVSPLEAIIQIFVPHNETVTFEDFITQRDDEIYVTVYKNGTVPLFHGWVVAEQGSQQMKDPPYIIELKCVDGLGLLKGTPLSSDTGSNFTGRVKLINILGGILKKANPELKIKTWCDIYESTMTDRDTDADMDMFSQTLVEARSFLNSEVAFVDCYEVLQRILSQHFKIFYYLGFWNIVRIADLQRSGAVHFVMYDLDGDVVPSTIFSPAGDSTTAKVGRTERILTHGTDIAIKTLEFAKKEARLQFDYKIPENLVNNQRLTQLGAFIAPLNGYALSGWTQKHRFLHLQTPISNQTAYIKVEFDAFGYEVQRYYVITVDLTATNAANLKNYIINNNDDFFVDQHDKVDFSFQYRYSVDLSDPNSTLTIGYLAIQREGTAGTSNSDWHNADNNGSWSIGSDPRLGVNLVGLNTTEWRTFSITDSAIPVNGRLYLGFGADDHLPSGAQIHIKDIQINYKPQIRGGYQTVKGDFNRYSQNNNYKNSLDATVFISDSPKRIISGSLLRADGTTLQTPTWYRRGVSEAKRYTQLVAQGVYNLHYRKFRKIEGQFRGYDYEKDVGGALVPIGPMTKFEFTDTGEARQYIVTRLNMNIKKGWFDATFREIYDPGSGDGDQNGDSYEFNYLF